MKRMIKALIATGVFAVMFTGCGFEEVEVKDVNPFFNDTDKEEIDNDETVFIWTDEMTGVQYVVYREKYMNAGFGGITPRLNADGTLCVVDTSNIQE